MACYRVKFTFIVHSVRVIRKRDLICLLVVSLFNETSKCSGHTGLVRWDLGWTTSQKKGEMEGLWAGFRYSLVIKVFGWKTLSE